MSSLYGTGIAFVVTLGFALWIASTWEQRERARRTLLAVPELAYVELAFEPFVYSMFRVLPFLIRHPYPFVPLAALSLGLLLSGRSPTSLATDEELAEMERNAHRRATAKRPRSAADDERE